MTRFASPRLCIADPVDLRDHVARMQVAVRSRAARLDPNDEQAGQLGVVVRELGAFEGRIERRRAGLVFRRRGVRGRAGASPSTALIFCACPSRITPTTTLSPGRAVLSSP